MKPKLIMVEMDNGARFVYSYERFIHQLKCGLVERKFEGMVER